MKKRDYSRLCRLFVDFSPSRGLHNFLTGEGCVGGARKNFLCKKCVHFYKGEGVADAFLRGLKDGMNQKREEERKQ